MGVRRNPKPMNFELDGCGSYEATSMIRSWIRVSLPALVPHQLLQLCTSWWHPSARGFQSPRTAGALKPEQCTLEVATCYILTSCETCSRCNPHRVRRGTQWHRLGRQARRLQRDPPCEVLFGVKELRVSSENLGKEVSADLQHKSS